ncbi:TPR-like protein [Polychaeton citri CBS 116435]|uniref:TPR-like protein n=1 Tax=Polychaeton citri CBS 116435 TaxID=1314669 RepID=A0A9P4Q439_9PEZI|nr:TPR-like protein [Polychaeton citri CBS 116435]
MALSQQQQAELITQLQQAVIACSERCLYFSAKWAAELLNSFPEDASEVAEDDEGELLDETPVTVTPANLVEVKRERKERSKYLLAKSFFDCREFDRCATVFLPGNAAYSAPVSDPFAASGFDLLTSRRKSKSSIVQRKASALPKPLSTQSLSQKSLFLALYARFLSGEKRKTEESETILGPADGPTTSNAEIPGILAILEEFFNSHGGLADVSKSQGWLDYLYGLCLQRSKSEALAKQWLLRSVNINPFNWSAWQELSSLLGSTEDLTQVLEHLPRNIITFFFHIQASQELYIQTPDVFNTLMQMSEIFPRSAFLLQQKALLHYHARDHDTAAAAFQSLIAGHPHRLDGLEIYSNLLYVLPSRPKLASLAQHASATDLFRPETNCILGNYYSLVSEHEKAVLHFRRALALDRGFSSAWTLMGHEYIELKNTQAAIESYRRAVDVSGKDYRAWYGLGQGYEMLECWSYSLFYYQRAAALCPGDAKMWAAVGNAYGRCGKLENAIQAYKRALIVGAQPLDTNTASSFSSSADPLANAIGGALDPQILYDLALLYERDGQLEECAAYMELCVSQEEGAEEGEEEGIGVTQVTSRARLWLARWCYQCGEWRRAMALANELCQDGVEVEEAKGLIRDVRGRLAAIDQGDE